MTAPSPAWLTEHTAVVEAVLGRHQQRHSTRGFSCTCGKHGITYRPKPWTAAEHRAHVAAKVVSALAAEAEKGGALSEAETRLRKHLYRTTGGFGLPDLDAVLAEHVAAARADERERIAEAIEEACDHPPRVGGWCFDCDRAVRIARAEGGE